ISEMAGRKCRLVGFSKIPFSRSRGLARTARPGGKRGGGSQSDEKAGHGRGIFRRLCRAARGTLCSYKFPLPLRRIFGIPEQMAEIATVRGALDTSQLGPTLMHEHVFVLDSEIVQNYPEEWGDEEKRVADAVQRLNELKVKGVDTIVDLT